MRRLIYAFIVRIWDKTRFLMARLICFWPRIVTTSLEEEAGTLLAVCWTWAATLQNQQNECAPSEDSDQPGHPSSLIRDFAVRMKKVWVLSYPLSAQRRLWSDWAHTHFVSFVMSWLTYFAFSSTTLPLRTRGGLRSLTVTLPSDMSPVTRKPVFGVSDQVRLKPVCSASEAS